jgi:hypothetical protein
LGISRATLYRILRDGAAEAVGQRHALPAVTPLPDRPDPARSLWRRQECPAGPA